MGARVGLIGYGVAGRILHAPLLSDAGFDLVGVVTRNTDRIKDLAADFPQAKPCSSVRELLEHDLDLVVVASRNSAHVDHARAAIEAGVAVVIDKPVAPTYEEVEELFDYADERSVPLTVFYNRLWDSDFLEIQEHRSLIEPIFRFESRYERWRPDVTGQSWRENVSEDEGGGVLIDLQSHLVASALALFGPAKLVYAKVQSVRGASNDDAQLTLEHKSGTLSVLSASAIVGSPGPRLRVLGRHGALTVESVDLQEVALRNGHYEALPSQIFLHRGEIVKELSGVPGQWSYFYEEVARALQNKSQMPISRQFALDVARILEDARKYIHE